MESSDEQVKLIANGLKGKYRQLILDKNGNFFCKDLFKICDQNERIEILKGDTGKELRTSNAELIVEAKPE